MAVNNISKSNNNEHILMKNEGKSPSSDYLLLIYPYSEVLGPMTGLFEKITVTIFWLAKSMIGEVVGV